ncbi:MAG: hypothetical protein M1839_003381 [Geoglossum umbratile]|nr:MAG: hypothetical protein M1839_003381 [Geoglossum umbratile]
MAFMTKDQADDLALAALWRPQHSLIISHLSAEQPPRSEVEDYHSSYDGSYQADLFLNTSDSSYIAINGDTYRYRGRCLLEIVPYVAEDHDDNYGIYYDPGEVEDSDEENRIASGVGKSSHSENVGLRSAGKRSPLGPIAGSWDGDFTSGNMTPPSSPGLITNRGRTPITNHNSNYNHRTLSTPPSPPGLTTNRGRTPTTNHNSNYNRRTPSSSPGPTTPSSTTPLPTRRPTRQTAPPNPPPTSSTDEDKENTDPDEAALDSPISDSDETQLSSTFDGTSSASSTTSEFVDMGDDDSA